MWTGEKPGPERPKGTPWKVLYENWESLKLDLLEVYGRDLSDPDDLARTSWHWFKEKVEGLLSMPPRTFLPDGAPLPPNRIQLALSE